MMTTGPDAHSAAVVAAAVATVDVGEMHRNGPYHICKREYFSVDSIRTDYYYYYKYN